jgi:outer membrane protein assembly factor BamB
MRGGTAVVRVRAMRATLAALALTALVAAPAGCGGGGTGGASAGTLQPRNGDWALPNADARNTRRVAGPIDARSVARLAVAWTLPAGPTASAPLVVDGVVYVQDLNSDVSAIDLRSGRVRWRRRYREPNQGPNGVTFGDGRLYGATESHVFALDARSGRQLWTLKLVQNGHEGIDMAPGYKDGTVYVSTVPTSIRAFYGPGGRGVLWAIDGATGTPRWRWAQVPAGLWGHPDMNGGGGLWHPPGFDERGNLYVAIGNPSPWPGNEAYAWGDSRPGPNRWTNSLAKLDARTGRLLWARQVLPHDVFDWDLECPPILTHARGRLVALAAGKLGFVFAFDATTGRLLWKRSVGVHNGHDDDGRKAMEGHGAELGRIVRVLPGQLGGVETPMAIDGDTVYVPVNDLYSTYVQTGESESGPLTQGRSEVVALDVASGRVKWDRRLPHLDFGATTVVNDLVVTATYDGTAWALRTDTGKVAWRASLPAGTNAPLTVSGDVLIAAAGVPQRRGQRTALAAYRLRP